MNLGAGYSTNRDDISQQLQDQQNNNVDSLPNTPWFTLKNYYIKNRQDLAQVRAFLKRNWAASAPSVLEVNTGMAITAVSTWVTSQW